MQQAIRCSYAQGAAAHRHVRLLAASSQAQPRRSQRSPVLVRSQGGDGSQAIAPAGQISSTLIDSMTGNIREALEAQKVQVLDVYGDGRHVAIDVVSELFDGKSSMQRQRMVYKAIWVELQEAVHAVDSMTTLTPAEAGL